jgi:hypothetical protein
LVKLAKYINYNIDPRQKGCGALNNMIDRPLASKADTSKYVLIIVEKLIRSKLSFLTLHWSQTLDYIEIVFSGWGARATVTIL